MSRSGGQSQFLEVRYGKITRYVVSALFILQMVLYMSSVLYAPVLALNAVTDLSIELSIIVFGTICTFYCAMGGLKAVLWSDVFQFILMFIAIMALYIAGIRETGSLENIYDRAYNGNRLNMFETLLISILPVIGLYLLCNLYGLILYSVYHLCDPISNKKATGLTKYDQTFNASFRMQANAILEKKKDNVI
ncbi:UNVERIFIED_CONTAM: Sodium-coupled monocarboxylate transporter 2 [Trichonephila clavipes]